MRRFATERSDRSDSSTHEHGIGITQACIGISLIVLGVVLLGIVVRTVMQL